MQLDVKIDPEEINRYMADQILQSAIGEKMKEVVARKIADLASPSYYGKESPLEAVVSDFIRNHLHSIIRDEYGDKVRAMISEKLTDEFVASTMDQAWAAFVTRINRD